MAKDREDNTVKRPEIVGMPTIVWLMTRGILHRFG